jgi:type VI secretion system protein ImpL
MVLSLVVLVRVLRAAPAARAAVARAELAERFPELADAWREIDVRLSQARIDTRAGRAVMILAPNEDWAAALIDACGTPLFARAPEAAAAVHAYATADTILITAVGASSFGTQEPGGSLRLEAIGRLIREWNPECPPLRGVVVVFPIRWAGQPDSVKWVAALRDDLHALFRASQVRCPVFAVFTEMETVPGFTELLGRMPELYKQARCGFAVPASRTFDGGLIQAGLDWMTGWFQGWAINLMAEDLLNHAGNQRLFGLVQEFRRYRKRLRSPLEVAFATHQKDEPVRFRGCYFTATGGSLDEQAFVSAVLGGRHGRVHTEHTATCWTGQAMENDRAYRRVALAIGSVGAILWLPGWLSILALAHNPWWSVGLIALIAAWAAALFCWRRW